jgi:hypothetical protein
MHTLPVGHALVDRAVDLEQIVPKIAAVCSLENTLFLLSALLHDRACARVDRVVARLFQGDVALRVGQGNTQRIPHLLGIHPALHGGIHLFTAPAHLRLHILPAVVHRARGCDQVSAFTAFIHFPECWAIIQQAGKNGIRVRRILHPLVHRIPQAVQLFFRLKRGLFRIIYLLIHLFGGRIVSAQVAAVTIQPIG